VQLTDQVQKLQIKVFDQTVHFGTTMDEEKRKAQAQQEKITQLERTNCLFFRLPDSVNMLFAGVNKLAFRCCHAWCDSRGIPSNTQNGPKNPEREAIIGPLWGATKGKRYLELWSKIVRFSWMGVYDQVCVLYMGALAPYKEMLTKYLRPRESLLFEQWFGIPPLPIPADRNEDYKDVRVRQQCFASKVWNLPAAQKILLDHILPEYFLEHAEIHKKYDGKRLVFSQWLWLKARLLLSAAGYKPSNVHRAEIPASGEIRTIRLSRTEVKWSRAVQACCTSPTSQLIRFWDLLPFLREYLSELTRKEEASDRFHATCLQLICSLFPSLSQFQ